MGSIDKAELRRTYRALRKSILPGERLHRENIIFGRVLAMPELQRCQTVFCFIGMQEEINTRLLIEALWNQNKTVYVPRCLDRNGTMQFFRIDTWEEVEQTIFGLSEPKLDCAEWPGTGEVFCLVPGLCFTPGGQRLGYGKGYYDRFLSKIRAIKVGICYNRCIVAALPQEQYDQTVDWVITEAAVYCTAEHSDHQINGGYHGQE